MKKKILYGIFITAIVCFNYYIIFCHSESLKNAWIGFLFGWMLGGTNFGSITRTFTFIIRKDEK